MTIDEFKKFLEELPNKATDPVKSFRSFKRKKGQAAESAITIGQVILFIASIVCAAYLKQKISFYWWPIIIYCICTALTVLIFWVSDIRKCKKWKELLPGIRDINDKNGLQKYLFEEPNLVDYCIITGLDGENIISFKWAITLGTEGE